MDNFVKILQQEISKPLRGRLRRRKKKLSRFKEKKEELVEIMSQGALEHGFK